MGAFTDRTLLIGVIKSYSYPDLSFFVDESRRGGCVYSCQFVTKASDLDQHDMYVLRYLDYFVI